MSREDRAPPSDLRVRKVSQGSSNFGRSFWTLHCYRRVTVKRWNVPETLIPPFGPRGGGQLLNYDIIEFPEVGNTKSSNQREFPRLKSGRGQMVSTQEQETLQLRVLKLLTQIKGLIKGTFPLSSFTLRLLRKTDAVGGWSAKYTLKQVATDGIFPSRHPCFFANPIPGLWVPDKSKGQIPSAIS